MKLRTFVPLAVITMMISAPAFAAPAAAPKAAPAKAHVGAKHAKKASAHKMDKAPTDAMKK